MELTDLDPEARYLFERRRRLGIVMTVVPALAAILLWLLVVTGLDERYLGYGFGVTRDLSLLVSVMLLAMSGLSLILTYLQTAFRASTEINLETLRASEQKELKIDLEQAKTADVLHRLELEVEQLRKEAQSTRAALGDLDEESRANLVAELRATL